MAENIKNWRQHRSLLGLLLLFILALLQLKYIRPHEDPTQVNKVDADLVQVASVSDKAGSETPHQMLERHNPATTMRPRHKPYFALNWPGHRPNKKSATALKRTKQTPELPA